VTTLDPRMLAFVAGRHAGVLATLERDGCPQLSNPFCAWVDEQQPACISVPEHTCGQVRG
jgi:hypothetical protein